MIPLLVSQLRLLPFLYSLSLFPLSFPFISGFLGFFLICMHAYFCCGVSHSRHRRPYWDIKRTNGTHSEDEARFIKKPPPLSSHGCWWHFWVFPHFTSAVVNKLEEEWRKSRLGVFHIWIPQSLTTFAHTKKPQSRQVGGGGGGGWWLEQDERLFSSGWFRMWRAEAFAKLLFCAALFSATLIQGS